MSFYLHHYLTQPFRVWLGGGEGSFYLHHYLTQLFRVWLGGWGGIIRGEVSFYLHHYLTQPFRVWLGGWGRIILLTSLLDSAIKGLVGGVGRDHSTFITT